MLGTTTCPWCHTTYLLSPAQERLPHFTRPCQCGAVYDVVNEGGWRRSMWRRPEPDEKAQEAQS